MYEIILTKFYFSIVSLFYDTDNVRVWSAWSPMSRCFIYLFFSLRVHDTVLLSNKNCSFDI
jgi:hypothetical protein